MKQLFSLICLIFLVTVLMSCHKSNNKKTSVSDSIMGTWELRQTSAAMNPVVGNYPPGNGKVLKFTDSEYEIYNDGQLVKKGPYTTVADATVETSVCLVFPAGQFTNRL